jgi:putative transposase
MLLRREGWVVNHKKVYRICREEQLLVPPRRHRRLRRIPHGEQPAPERPNQSWAMDFMQDGLADGRTLRILTIIDRYTREALALEVDIVYSGPANSPGVGSFGHRARVSRRHSCRQRS